MSVQPLFAFPDAPMPCPAAERRDAFRWGAAADLALARRELGRRRRHAAEALLRRAEAALLAAWDEGAGLPVDQAPRDRAYSRLAGAIAGVRARLPGAGIAELGTAQAALAEAIGAVRALEAEAGARAA